MNRKSLSPVSKLNSAWIQQVKDEFCDFLNVTRFSEPKRDGTRGSTFQYRESLILLIAVLAVKCKVKSYQGIHRLVVQYWSILTPTPDTRPISKSQLWDRIKKIRHTPRKPTAFISQFFPETVAIDRRQR